MVTTNYDDFLGQALTAQAQEVDAFKAPALPLGDDFEGLVYLHGHLSQDSKKLVVTDQDFGAAYITRHWASDFLRELFRKYVVCFVGYSHSDHLMEYFARGMGSDSKPRYIFTEQTSAEAMRQRGLIPIAYPDGQHELLTEVLTLWSTHASMSSVTRANRVRGFAGVVPPTGPDDTDFLVESLGDHRLVDEVCAVATSLAWFQWLVARPICEQVLDPPPSVEGKCAHALASWFAERVLADEDISKAARQWLNRHPIKPGAILPLAVATELWQSGKADRTLRHAWLDWCLDQSAASPDMFRWLNNVWGHGAKPDEDAQSSVELDEAHVWSLFRYLTDQWLGPVPGLTAFLIRSAELRVAGDGSYTFLGGLSARFSTLSSKQRERLLSWVQDFVHGAEARGFGWSWQFAGPRLADEPDRRSMVMRDVAAELFFLVARAIQSEAIDSPKRSALRARLWLGDHSPLIRRFGLLGLEKCDLNPNEKADILVEDDLLGDYRTGPEFFDLLSAIVPNMSSKALARLIAAIEMPADLDKSGEVRHAYELLSRVVVSRKRPAKAALAKARENLALTAARYPEWVPRDDPGRVFAEVKTGSWSAEDLMPWTPGQFHQMLNHDPRQTAADLFQKVRDGNPSFDHHRRAGDWFGPDQMLVEVVKAQPSDGLVLWEAIGDAEVTVDERQTAKGHVVRGFGEAELDEQMVARVFDCLNREAEDQPWSALADFLSPWGAGETSRAWATVPSARRLAAHVFEHVRNEGSDLSGEADLMILAINSSVGQLASFWVQAAVADADAGTYPGGLLSNEVSTAVERLIKESRDGRLASAPLLRSVQFFNQADPDWTREQLFPLIDPAKGWEQVAELWEPVFSGHWDDALLETPLRSWLVDYVRKIEPGEKSRVQPQLMLALITVRSTMSVEQQLEWMTELSAVKWVKRRFDWLTTVGWQLGELDHQSRHGAWSAWGREYVRRRVNSQPLPLAPDEVAALLHWAVHLDKDDLAECASLLMKTTCGLPVGDHGFSPDLKEAVKREPIMWAQLAGELLKTTTTQPEAPTWPGLRLFIDEVVEAADGLVTDADLMTIRSEAHRLGVGGVLE
ncbi:MAG: DUF4020 domain-containing protein [Propionibacteriaceae bacterium]|nr:DUF4020 domain-containing protein [Propionibacteriaceae bacterium]